MVGDEIRSWYLGKVLVIDDTQTHQVWHGDLTSFSCLILPVDVTSSQGSQPSGDEGAYPRTLFRSSVLINIELLN